MKSVQQTFALTVLLSGIVVFAACESEMRPEQDFEDNTSTFESEISTPTDPPLTQPMSMRSGAWWGNIATPLENQIWGTVLNATPGKNLNEPFVYKYKCELPLNAGFRQSLKLVRASIHVDSTKVYSPSGPVVGQEYSASIDPSKYSAGWHEIRVRCLGEETEGAEKGQVTAITAGFPIQFNGSTGGSVHTSKNFVDTHGWYSRGVGYSYATINNISRLLSGPISGKVTLDLRARTEGDTTLDHFMLKIDGQVTTDVEGNLVEIHGHTTQKLVTIDTTKLTNGVHRFAMHSHGIENTGSENPGKQVAAQVEVDVQVSN